GITGVPLPGIASLGLRLAYSQLRVLNQFTVVSGCSTPKGYADTGTDVEHMLINQKRTGKHTEQIFRGLQYVLLLDLPTQQHAKFIPGEAGKKIPGFQPVSQPGCHRLKQLITGGVAQAFVDRGKESGRASS